MFGADPELRRQIAHRGLAVACLHYVTTADGTAHVDENRPVSARGGVGSPAARAKGKRRLYRWARIAIDLGVHALLISAENTQGASTAAALLLIAATPGRLVPVAGKLSACTTAPVRRQYHSDEAAP